MEFADPLPCADEAIGVDAIAPGVLEGESENIQFLGKKLAPYNPTNIDAVHIALDMLALDISDVFFDLGCGDGRLLIEVIEFDLYILVCKLSISFANCCRHARGTVCLLWVLSMMPTWRTGRLRRSRKRACKTRCGMYTSEIICCDLYLCG